MLFARSFPMHEGSAAQYPIMFFLLPRWKPAGQLARMRKAKTTKMARISKASYLSSLTATTIRKACQTIRIEVETFERVAIS